MKIKFPQINRKLTAYIFTVLFIFISIANIAQNRLFKVDEEKKLRLVLLQNPNFSGLHEKLGQYYFETNEEAARREYRLAQDYYIALNPTSKADVLGSRSSPWQNWQNLISQKQTQDKEIKYWQKVQTAYPRYLYASLKLAAFSLQKREPENAKKYLEIILREDPTDQNALKFFERISKN